MKYTVTFTTTPRKNKSKAFPEEETLGEFLDRVPEIQNKKGWLYVELNSLEELKDFIVKTGRLVILSAYGGDEAFDIEIYNDYRE